MTLADVLDGMFRLFLAHWRTYVITLAIVLVPLQFVLAVLAGIAGLNVGILDQFTNPATAQAAFQNGPAIVAAITFLAFNALSAIFATPFVTGLGCRIAASAIDGATPGPREVLREVLHRYWSLVGVAVLSGLAGIAVMVVPAALLLWGATTESAGFAVFGGILAFCGFFVVVWLLVRFTLAYAAVVVERIGPVAALRRSVQLVKGRWWRIFGTMLLASLVSGIVAQVAAFPFALPGNLFGPAAGVVLVTIGTVITGIIATPLATNAQTLLYFDGRIRNEGYDLEMMISGVAGTPPPPPPPTGPAFG